MINRTPRALKALLAGIVLISTGACAAGMTRDQAFEAIQGFEEARKGYIENRQKALAAAKTTEEKRKIIGSFRNMPHALDLADEAQLVIHADATDDKAFFALKFIRCEIGQSGKAYESALELLLKHHIGNKNIVDAIGRLGALLSYGDQINIWEQIAEQNRHPEAKANALLKAMKVFADLAGQPMSMDERKLLVEQVENRAERIARDFPDITYVDRNGDERLCVDKAQEIYAAAKSLLGAQLADFVGVVNLDGETDLLSNYRGKYVLLNFWATWCGPCIAGMPALVTLSEELEGQPFQVITVSLDDDIETILEFQEERQPMPWVNWHMGPDHPARDELNISGIPLYILVDPEGNILSRTNAFDDTSKKHLKQLVKSKSG